VRVVGQRTNYQTRGGRCTRVCTLFTRTQRKWKYQQNVVIGRVCSYVFKQRRVQRLAASSNVHKKTKTRNNTYVRVFVKPPPTTNAGFLVFLVRSERVCLTSTTSFSDTAVHYADDFSCFYSFENPRPRNRKTPVPNDNNLSNARSAVHDVRHDTELLFIRYFFIPKPTYKDLARRFYYIRYVFSSYILKRRSRCPKSFYL